jgi:hypothetical protein
MKHTCSASVISRSAWSRGGLVVIRRARERPSPAPPGGGDAEAPCDHGRAPAAATVPRAVGERMSGDPPSAAPRGIPPATHGAFPAATSGLRGRAATSQGCGGSWRTLLRSRKLLHVGERRCQPRKFTWGEYADKHGWLSTALGVGSRAVPRCCMLRRELVRTPAPLLGVKYPARNVYLSADLHSQRLQVLVSGGGRPILSGRASWPRGALGDQRAGGHTCSACRSRSASKMETRIGRGCLL